VHERILAGTAASWNTMDVAELNTIAITCLADPGVVGLSRLAGLPDAAYHHDGQLTKREVRAMTLAALAPVPGQLLWDVGAGCGSIGIEWMRSASRCRAIAIEHHPTRLQYIADNAAALGTPNLQIIAGEAPAALKDLPPPDALFIGGGLTTDQLLPTCWHALRAGGRFVANAVTVASEQMLLQWHSQWGGELTRIAIQRAAPIGAFIGWKALVPVTQWVVVKP
jgi:precorrin-6Y C5,15-methyltransferase (decarboxylating)